MKVLGERGECPVGKGVGWVPAKGYTRMAPSEDSRWSVQCWEQEDSASL